MQKIPANATLPPLFALAPLVTRLALGRRVVASRPQGARRAPPCQPEPASLRTTAAPSVTACTRSALTAAPSACRRAWPGSEPLAPNPRRCCAPALPCHGLNHRQRLRPWLVAHNLQNSGPAAAGGQSAGVGLVSSVSLSASPPPARHGAPHGCAIKRLRRAGGYGIACPSTQSLSGSGIEHNGEQLSALLRSVRAGAPDNPRYV